jgi:hypothetical protein
VHVKPVRDGSAAGVTMTATVMARRGARGDRRRGAVGPSPSFIELAVVPWPSSGTAPRPAQRREPRGVDLEPRRFPVHADPPRGLAVAAGLRVDEGAVAEDPETQGSVSRGEVATESGLSRELARRALVDLTRLGHLRRLGRERGTRYVLP